MDFSYIWIILTIVVALILIYANKKPKNRNTIIEAVLSAILLVMVGLSSIWAFLGHAFMSDQIAAYIGWPAGNPFQLEVAVANLSYGILGVLCLKFRDNFWMATIISFTIFYWGAAYIHLMEITQKGNLAPGNAGMPLYYDIIIPIILIALFIAYKMTLTRQVKD